MLTEEVSRHSKMLHDSFTNLMGKPLLETPCAEEALAKALYHAPFVLLSHDTQEDPVFNYANQTAQKLWELDWEQGNYMVYESTTRQLMLPPGCTSNRSTM